MKKLMSLGLIAMSVMMFSGCEDPVSENSGTAPQIAKISAEKTEFSVNAGNLLAKENTTVTLKIIDAEKNLSKIRMINMGQVQDMAWPGEMASTEIDAQLIMQIPVGMVLSLPVSYIAIDSKGNMSDTAKITFTVKN